MKMQLTTFSGRLEPLKRGQDDVTHLLFADDMLLFCRGTKSSASELNNLLEEFHLNTGLQVNKNKSKLYLSKSCKNQELLSAILGVSLGTLPMKYLGLPLTSVYPKPKHFAALLDISRCKVDGWSLNLLSFPGRIELIKSVLQNLISYWIFSFKLPNSVIRELERIYAKFLWNGRMHVWKWDELCKPKKEGALDFKEYMTLWRLQVSGWCGDCVLHILFGVVV